MLRRLISIMVLVSAAFLVAPATVAQADSGWQCTTWVAITDPSAKICIRTVRKDSTHLAGVDVSYYRSPQAEGCRLVRFSHRTALGNDQALGGFWWDDGAFTICPNQTRSFYWTHAGAGAPIPSGWNVLGQLSFLPPTSPQLTYTSPRVWHPNH